MELPLSNSRIQLSSGQIFWREIGRGPILVFLHGSWSDSSQWLPVIKYLSQDYHCFAPDLLGFGDSVASNLNYSIQLEVECLCQYLEALHLSQVYLIGHSLGAWIGASYALQYSHQVSGLVLLSPEGVQAPRQEQSWWWARCIVEYPRITYGILRTLRPLVQLWGGQKSIDQALQRRQQLLSSPAACQLLFQRRYSEIQGELLQENLDWLKVPCLILQGRTDTTEAIARSQIYAQKTPQAQLQMIERVGNNLPEALPAVVARHIHEFVSTQIRHLQ
ncbi:MAG: alpha/beta hydrolase [Symploca sp. SIO2E9]|nr:alpha/beta hydrolase [Symploca sp. SIO2E9]